MPERRIVIRADGGTSIGMGHVVRCMALADMLRSHFTITFCIRRTAPAITDLISAGGYHTIGLSATDMETDLAEMTSYLRPDDIVVIDGYHFRTEYQQQIKTVGCKLVAIDDLHAWHHVADVVINHAGGVSNDDYSCEPYTRLLLGPAYVLLRKEFLQAGNTPRQIREITSYMISMGAADVNDNTRRFAQALLQLPRTDKVHLLLSDINPHLAAIHALQQENPQKIFLHFNLDASQLVTLISECHLVICPASTISLEACAVGVGIVSGWTAENQRGILNGLLKNGLAFNADDLNSTSATTYIQNLVMSDDAVNEINSQITKQSEFFDGRSGQRIMGHFRELSTAHRNSNLSIRIAAMDDARLYFDWANDAEVRANSFNHSAILWEDHMKWFAKSVSDPQTLLLIFQDEKIPVGQIRFRINNQTALLNYSVAANYRGKGLAKVIVDLAAEYLRNHHPHIRMVKAEVMPSNIASIKVFEGCGFTRESEDQNSLTFVLSL